MKRKYEKPIQRNIRDLALASGACLSGISPAEQCAPGNTNTANCNSGSSYSPTSCGPGTSATDCGTGTYASSPGG